MELRIGSKKYNRVRVLETLFLDHAYGWKLLTEDDDPEESLILYPCGLTLDYVYVSMSPELDWEPGFNYTVDHSAKESGPEFTAKDLVDLITQGYMEVVE